MFNFLKNSSFGKKAEPPPKKENPVLESFSPQLWELSRHVLNYGLYKGASVHKVIGSETYLFQSKTSVLVFRNKSEILQKVFDCGEEGVNKFGPYMAGKIPSCTIEKISASSQNYFVATNGTKVEIELLDIEYVLSKARETILA